MLDLVPWDSAPALLVTQVRVYMLYLVPYDLLQRKPADRVVGSECVTLARALLTLVLALLSAY